MLRATGHARMVKPGKFKTTIFQFLSRLNCDRTALSGQQACISFAWRAPYGNLHTCVSKASCPNFEPRARLTGLTSRFPLVRETIEWGENF